MKKKALYITIHHLTLRSRLTKYGASAARGASLNQRSEIMFEAIRNVHYRGDIVTALRINHGVYRVTAAKLANVPTRDDVEALRAEGVTPAQVAAKLFSGWAA